MPFHTEYSGLAFGLSDRIWMSEDAFGNFPQIPFYRITIPFYRKLKQIAFGSFGYVFITTMYKLCTDFKHLRPTVCIFFRHYR